MRTRGRQRGLAPFNLAKHSHSEGTDFVVSEIAADAVDAVGDLEWLIPFVERRGETFAFTYPAGTPHVDAAFDHLQSVAGEMWLQHAEEEPADWRGAFRKFAALVDGSGVEWAVIGGVALAIRGVEAAEVTQDVDIITTPAGAQRLNEVCAQYLTAPTIELPDWGWFGRAYLGAKVEWLGQDVYPHAWRFDHPWEQIEWEGHDLLVPSLELYLEIERRRGRHDRADGIEAVLAR